MSPLLLVSLLLVVGTAAAAWPGDGALHWEAREELFCYPFNYSCGPIPPTPPSSYEAHIEHVDLAYDTTHYIEEFYDYEENMLAVTDSSGSTYTHTIFFFDLNTAVYMSTERETDGGRYPTTCTVAEISHDTLFHPFPGTNGTVHLVLAPSQALLFGNNYRYSYVENGTQREMECNQWDACINTGRGSFYVEYYWSDPSLVFDMYGYRGERPIKMRMSGIAEPPQGSTKPLEVDSLFSVALFDDSPNLKYIRWAFEIPSGVYCEGFPSEKNPPTRMSSVYSMRVEVTVQPTQSSLQEYMSTVKNWYDFYNKLTRVDSITNPTTVEFAVAGLVQVASIRDFRAGVEYIIDKTLGNCTTIALTGGGYDTITTPDGHYTIKDPLLIFGLGMAGNLTYHGMKYARGLPCDVWVGHMDFEYDNDTIDSAYLYELYFLQSGWSEDAGVQDESLAVPVMIKLHQDFTVDQLPGDLIVNLQQNIFKFEEEQPLTTVYDITPCFFGHEHIRRFQMAFPSTYRNYFENDPTLFTTEVRDSLIMYYLEIPFIRLQHIQIEYVEEYNRLFCEFTLVDQPQVDMEMPPYVGKPLDQVVQQLKDSMNDLTIIITDEHESPILMKAIKDSLRELFEDGCYSRYDSSLPLHDLDNPQPVTHATPMTRDDQPERRPTEGEERGDSEAFMVEMQQWARSGDEKMYTPGDMAGMAMGMLVLGLLLGTVIMLVILKKMGLSNDIEFIPMSSRRQ